MASTVRPGWHGKALRWGPHDIDHHVEARRERQGELATVYLAKH
jgi:hypothetical protein